MCVWREEKGGVGGGVLAEHLPSAVVQSFFFRFVTQAFLVFAELKRRISSDVILVPAASSAPLRYNCYHGVFFMFFVQCCLLLFIFFKLVSQAIFFGGVDPPIRGEVWPFLLHYYSYDSTSQEREAWRLQKRTHYHDIQQRR